MTMTEFITVCSWIIAIGGAAAVIIKLFRPLFKMQSRIDALEKHEKTDLEKFARIDLEFAQTRKSDQAQFKAMLAILNHMIDGNSIETMKQARAALNEHIIEKQGES